MFSSLVLTLRDEGYISDSGDAEPAETMKVYQLLAELITLRRAFDDSECDAGRRVIRELPDAAKTPYPAFHNLQIQ